MAAGGGSATATGGATAGGGVARVTAPLLVSADGIKSCVNRYRVISLCSAGDSPGSTGDYLIWNGNLNSMRNE